MATAGSLRCCMPAALLALAATASVHAAGWTVVPRIGATETYTDNVTLAPSALRSSDFVTEIRPGIGIHGAGARARLSLDYELQEILYARDSSRNRTQNALNAIGSLEAVEKFFFIDARAVISQQSVSAFGPQGFSNANVTSNRGESRVFTLSPYVRGSIGSLASYEVRHNAVRSSSDASAIASSRSAEWTAGVRNLVAMDNFGWALDYAKRSVGFTGASDSDSESARATLLYQFDPQFRASVNFGRETNNYGLGTQSYSNRGIGFQWRPSPSTDLSAQRDRRFFGTGHNYRFNHRTPLSTWSAGYVRDVTSTADQLQASVPSDFYTLLFNRSDYVTLFPDPAQRDLRVRSDLFLLGLPATAANQTLLANRLFLDRRLDASMALLGARNGVTFGLFRSRRAAATGAATADAFSGSPEIAQKGLNASWSHRVSALTSLNLLVSHIRSSGVAPVSLETTQRLLNLSLSHQFGPKTTGSLGLRHVQFDSSGGPTSSYGEKALTGALSVSF